jgi:molecular chaperone DnaJ
LLSDPQKKAAWDQFGAAGFDQTGGFDPSSAGGGPGGAGNPFGGGAGGFSGGFGGFSAEFSFEDLFSAFTGGGGGRRGRSSRGSPFQQEILMGDHIELRTTISLEEAARGLSKTVTTTPMVQCRTCAGSGLRKGVKPSTCPQCQGSGTRVHQLSNGFQMASTCGTCGGQGVVVPSGNECGECDGEGVVRERRNVRIQIPAGVEDGMRLRVAGEGDAPATGLHASASVKSARGDLFVLVSIAPDKNFSRAGADILHTASIPLTTAVLGGVVTIPTLEGPFALKVPRGTAPGDTISVPQRGMKKLNHRYNARGDLKVEFRVQMPRALTARQRSLLEQLADELGDQQATRTMNVNKEK